jgi:hypothetical protein
MPGPSALGVERNRQVTQESIPQYKFDTMHIPRYRYQAANQRGLFQFTPEP